MHVSDDSGQPASADAPYDGLTPDSILDALAQVGLMPDGRMFALNSYENRVYQAGVEDSAPVVVKFYRPGRCLPHRPGRRDSRSC